MKKLLAVIAILALGFTVLPSCKNKVNDTDVKAAAEKAIAENPDFANLSVGVSNGVVTVTGEVKDEATRIAAQEKLAKVEGVKNVQNNTSVYVAPPVTVPPPVIATNDSLTIAVNDAVKDNPGVKVSVTDGVVILTGEIKKSDLPKLMQKISATRPKKIDNKLTVN